jgi:hypothetical protein
MSRSEQELWRVIVEAAQELFAMYTTTSTITVEKTSPSGIVARFDLGGHSTTLMKHLEMKLREPEGRVKLTEFAYTYLNARLRDGTKPQDFEILPPCVGTKSIIEAIKEENPDAAHELVVLLEKVRALPVETKPKQIRMEDHLEDLRP